MDCQELSASIEQSCVACTQDLQKGAHFGILWQVHHSRSSDFAICINEQVSFDPAMECQTWPLGLVGFAIPEHCDIQVHRVHLTGQLRISRIPSDTETSETCPKDCRFETIPNSKPFNHFCPNAPLQSANIIAPPCGQCSSPPWIPAQCCHRLLELRD